MSLINDMLRDLEQRRDQQPELSSGPTAVSGLGKTRKPSLALAALLGVGIVCGGIVYYLVPSQTTTANVLSKTAQQGGVIQPLENGNSSKLTAPTMQEDLSSVAVDRVLEVVEPELELSTLEVVAEENRALFTLHFPKVPEYRLEQQEKVEKRLVIAFPDTVIGRDLSIPEFGTDTLLREFSLKPAPDKLLLLVDLNHEGVIDSVQTRSGNSGFLLEISIQFSPSAARSKPASPLVTSNPPVAAEPVDSSPKPVSVVTEQPAQQNPEPGSRIGKVAVKAETSQHAYLVGMQQLARGEVSAAKDSFSRALLQRPDFVDARIQLIGVLQQQQQYREAEAVVEQGLRVSPGEPVLRKLMARQLMSSQSYTKGIELLTRSPLPEMTRDQEYYALLAVMYHDAAEYQRALDIYQGLVKVRPENATWWFGLAICADQVLDIPLAQRAYQSALQLPSLRADLQVYARQRLEQL